MKTREDLLRTISTLKEQRETIGKTTYQTIMAALEAELAALEAMSAPTPHDKAQAVWLTFKTHVDAAWLIFAKQRGAQQLPAVGEYERLAFDGASITENISRAVQVALRVLKTHEITFFIMLAPANDDILAEKWAQLPMSLSPSLYIDEEAYTHIRGIFIVRETSVAGIYQILENKDRAFPIQHRELEIIIRDMIGRDAELAQLKNLFNRAIEEKRAFGALIIGNNGVGKSRLLLELDKWLELWPYDVWHLEAQSTTNAQHVMYGLIRDALSYRFDIHEDDDRYTAQEKLFSQIGLLVSEESDHAAHFIGQLVGYDYSTSPHLLDIRADVQRFREVAYEMLVKLFRAAAHHYKGLVYLRLDDIHDADTASLEILDYLLSTVIDFPLVIVAAAQPRLLDRYTLSKHFEVINLRSLSATVMNQLLDHIFGVGRLPLSLRQSLIDRTNGNPYHLEEAIRLLQDEGILDYDLERGWHLTENMINIPQIPTTIDGVIQARVNALPPNAQQTLQQAAVVGRIFWDRILLYLQTTSTQTIDEESVYQALALLEKRNLIMRRASSIFANTKEYIFQQATVHRVVYDSVRQQQAQRYHLRIAQWLIGRTREGVGENASMIAHHFARANDTHRAIKWYALAAQQAFSAYLPDRALRYYELAFELIPDYLEDLQLQIRLYNGYGQVLGAQGNYTDAMAAYTAVWMAAEKAQDVLWQARAWNAMSSLQTNLIVSSEALEYADRAAQLAEKAGPQGREELANAYLNFALVYNSQDKPQAAIEWTEKALLVIENLPNNIQLLARAYNTLGESYYYLNNYPKALEANQKALEIMTASSPEIKPIHSRILNDLAFIHYRMGEYKIALKYAEEALQLSRDYGTRRHAIYFVNNYGIILMANQLYEKAETYLYQVVRMVGPLGWWGMVGTYLALCECHLGLNKLREAQSDALHALEWAKRTQNASDLCAAWRMLGVVSEKRREPIELDGRYIEAEDCFANSRRAVINTNHRAELAHTLWAWGKYLRRRDPQRADRLLYEAQEIFTELQLPKLAEYVQHDR